MNLTRRDLLISSAAATGISMLNATMPSFAFSPGSQNFTNLTFGDANVVALSDGTLSLKLDMYATADKAEAMKLLNSANLKADSITSALNAYIIKIKGKTILIDAGHNATVAPTAGKLAENMKFAGLEASKVDAILLTHMHPDHIGGLSTNGMANFPNATLFIAESEYNFWHDDGILANAPEKMRPAFANARAAVAPYVAAKKSEKFTPGKEIVPSITSIAAIGHTPGHTMYHIGSGKNSLLIWGDIVHTPAIQFAHPEWAIAFDSDKNQAIETRKKIFDMVATDKLTVAGMHIPFTGVGKVQKDVTGYKFVAT